VDDIVRAIGRVEAKLADLDRTTITYLKDLIARYGAQHPRRTEVSEFDEVNKKAVAHRGIRLAYDPETGFFGSQVKGKERVLTVSEFDRILAVTGDGVFRIVSPPEKILLAPSVVHLDRFDEEKGIVFTVVYRNAEKLLYGKKVKIQKFVRGREYKLMKDRGARLVYLTAEKRPGTLHMNFVPRPRQRVKEGTFDLGKLSFATLAARGTRLAAKPVARVKVVRKKNP
jgi:topoisomerase-4 subunit A